MTDMIENSYVALLKHDNIKMRHPTILNKIVVLYRIIATKSFHLKSDVVGAVVVNKYDIGGYVESIDNLDPDNPVWLENQSRVFDKAKLLNNTYLTDYSAVFGDAVLDNTRMENYSRAYGKVTVTNSVLSDLTEVRNNAKVFNSTLKNSSIVINNATVNDSTLSEGASVTGNSVVTKCKISDIAQVNGDAKISNCILNNAAAVKNGIHEHTTMSSELNLAMSEGKD